MNLNKILLLLFKFYDKTIRGKTLIQKRGYFLADYLEKDFGYYAHYYGPYSDEVNYALDMNCGLGFLKNSILEYGYDQKRYEYILTKDGNELLDFIVNKEKSITQNIEKFHNIMIKAGDDNDYNKLSYAAKVHYIFNNLEKNNDLKKIEKNANSFGWKLSVDEIKKGLEFLSKYEEIKTSI